MQDNRDQSLIVRWARRLMTVGVTAGFLVVAGGLVWQGRTLIADRAEAVEKPEETVPLIVSTSVLQMRDGYTVQRQFTGQIETLQSADLSFERGGTLVDVLVDDGEAVERGTLIARLDDRLLGAEINRLEASKRALQAQLELAEATDKRQAELNKRGFASAQTADQTRLSIAEIEARVAETDAAILAARINLEKAELRAPFAGRINQRLLDPGTTVGAGQAVVSLLESAKPVFRVGITPELGDPIRSAQKLSVEIGDDTHAASVIAVLPQVDAATRTRIVRLRLDDAPNVAIGQTGTVSFDETVEARGAWVPLTALEDGIRGLWTIKTVTDQDPPMVAGEAVEIVYADERRAFVRGTFTGGARFIDEGIHRVATGQPVRVAN